MPQLNAYQNELEAVLQSVHGRYITAYQAFRILEDKYPQVAQALVAAYPMQQGNPPMGRGAGGNYSPASYISHAYEHLSQPPGHIRREDFCPMYTELGAVQASADDSIAIWAWR